MGQELRILQVLGRLDRGGAETMIMSLYRHMDRSRIQFDFVIHTKECCDYTEEVERLGGRIYSMKPFRASTALGYRKQWRRFFREHPEYEIVHGHMRSTASLYLWEAKRAGRKTIVHSHNTSSGRGLSALVKNILQLPLRYEADYLVACSHWAGEWLYGRSACRSKRFFLLKNGIETGAFVFEETIRRAKRRELLGEGSNPGSTVQLLGEESNPGNAAQPAGEGSNPEGVRAQEPALLLHVGRLETQKNHGFLLQIMAKAKSQHKNWVLFLCGAGPLEESLRAQVKEEGLEETVRFLGSRSDVPALMQAADLVLFPSLFEGLPVTLVEAQAAGLFVLMSDTITKEVILTELVQTMGLKKTPEQWMQKAQEMLAQPVGERRRFAHLVQQKGYDVKQNAEILSAFYERLHGRA